ncbi:hypothetical protein RirG_049840 [Rhizophagus irregularis DAOM 197198w]|uniref:Kelch-like protein 17 n=1 Tax=Rhizophagus irregularis (strain DAOM 197198w) TaxID=1432141 RepID=A0A015JYF5_RHIIW|nr:hypothetical protein RirG_049840 [Rhizophagus irregularis DAOM 197198w]
MSTQFFSKLSQNYIELLKDSEYYDVTIEVGEDPDVKIFRAHMNILCYRSPYFRRNLNKKNNDNFLFHIKLPNISPEIFQFVLEYIYGGILSLNGQDTLDFLKILAAADILCLQELINYLQKYLIESKSEWMEQHFEFTQQISSQSNNLLELQEFCTNLMVQSPEKIFKSFDFTSLSESSLISLIKSDDLQMNEVEVWEHVLKWGLAQNPTLIPDPSTWTDDDFNKMKITLQNCIPLVRFFCLSSKEFLYKVRPYQKLLNNQFYEELLNSYLDPNSVSIHNIFRPRKIVSLESTAQIIDSQIVNSSIVSTILNRINKTVNKKFEYKFELLLRGSRDGFTPKKFHELCDGKHNTVTFIKIKGTEEIVGGYNPLTWESHTFMAGTKKSFIFSFKNKNIKDAIISNVKNSECAILCSNISGPYFGSDIIICASSESVNYNKNWCKKKYYEKSIRETTDPFSIEDYEVFQIIQIKKR